MSDMACMFCGTAVDRQRAGGGTTCACGRTVNCGVATTDYAVADAVRAVGRVASVVSPEARLRQAGWDGGRFVAEAVLQRALTML